MIALFYYLGRKMRIAGLYPDPVHPTIIEPFAGSAAYSLYGDRWENDVVLIEKDPDVCDVWRFLLSASRKDIEHLPNLSAGDRLDSHNYLSNGEKWLIRFAINPGSSQRSNIVTKFSRWSASKRYVLNNLHKVRHWTLIEGDYSLAPNTPATWFIDPPYHRSGRFYRTNDVDYSQLAQWVYSREGQVTVCEQSGADWIPFEPLIVDRAARGKRIEEVVYRQSHPAYELKAA